VDDFIFLTLIHSTSLRTGLHGLTLFFAILDNDKLCYVLIETRLVWVVILETVSLSTIEYSDSVSLIYIIYDGKLGVK